MSFISIKHVRWVAIGLVAAGLILFLGALCRFPAYARQLPLPLLPNDRWTAEAAKTALASLGWTAQTYMWWRLGFVVVTAVFYCGLGIFILLRRSTDPFALLLALSLVVFGTAATDVPYILAQWGAIGARAAYGLSVLSYGMLIFLITLFPNGRFVPSWTRSIVILGTALMIYAAFLQQHILLAPRPPPLSP